MQETQGRDQKNDLLLPKSFGFKAHIKLPLVEIYMCIQNSIQYRIFKKILHFGDFSSDIFDFICVFCFFVTFQCQHVLYACELAKYSTNIL